MKRFFVLSILITLIAFFGCDTPESLVLDQILKDPSRLSPYTGGLKPVGSIKGFGVGTSDPIALEWNGKTLYMIAGRFHNQYLYTVDRNTGAAKVVNRNAKNLGGTFMIYEIEFKDMTWHPETNQMLAVDHRGYGAIFPINLHTGFAGHRISKEAFGLYNPKDDTKHGREFGGYPVIGSPIAITYAEGNVYMWGMTGRNKRYNERGFHSFGALYEISNLKNATPIGEPKIHVNGDETHAYSLCFDGDFIYMSGANTQSLYILNEKTSETYFVASFFFVEMPDGFKEHEVGGILNIKKDIIGNIWITGLAYDGIDMYAIDSWTNALYKLEKR